MEKIWKLHYHTKYFEIFEVPVSKVLFLMITALRGVPQTRTLRFPLKLHLKPRVLGYFDIPFFMPNWTKSRNVLNFLKVIFFLCDKLFFLVMYLVSFWNQKFKKKISPKKNVYHVLNLFRNLWIKFKKKFSRMECDIFCL